MKTKTIFLWLLLLMLVGGVNGAWGDTYKLILNSKPFTETKNNSANTGFFSVAGDYNINSKFNGATYDGITFSNGLKLESNKGDITFSCSADSLYVEIRVPLKTALSDADTLFTPAKEHIPYLLCRQIIRDHGEATNRRGCGIRAEGNVIIITLPAVSNRKS